MAISITCVARRPSISTGGNEFNLKDVICLMNDCLAGAYVSTGALGFGALEDIPMPA